MLNWTDSHRQEETPAGTDRGWVVIEVSAPVRICDNGGWTDTWFGGPGRVLNIAVFPGVEVTVRPTDGPDPVVLDVRAFDDRYPIVPGAPRRPRHPLLESAFDAYPPPPHLAVEVSVRSDVPAGCGTGTSAAVSVALVAALSALRSERPSPREIAYAAHRLEVDTLGIESGIQDQLCAALGGINYIEVEPYPEAVAQALPGWDELGPRLSLVFLGRAHNSSDLHGQVIAGLGRRETRVFSRLREAATAARDAVLTRDLDAFGRAMTDNTEAQRSLHPGLVGVDADRVIGMAVRHGALGWKVNGAGGDGGSVTILSATQEGSQAMASGVALLDPRYRTLPVRLSRTGCEVRGALP
jgi:D-glycero-alpha-D-manno-heptose-7-phosphate kinase